MNKESFTISFDTNKGLFNYAKHYGENLDVNSLSFHNTTIMRGKNKEVIRKMKFESAAKRESDQSVF